MKNQNKIENKMSDLINYINFFNMDNCDNLLSSNFKMLNNKATAWKHLKNNL